MGTNVWPAGTAASVEMASGRRDKQSWGSLFFVQEDYGEESEMVDLFVAVSAGSVLATKTLLVAEVDPEVGIGDDSTPLDLAALGGYVGVAEVLLRDRLRPVPVVTMPGGGDTPLHHALFFRHASFVGLLLCYGALPSSTCSRNSRGTSANAMTQAQPG